METRQEYVDRREREPCRRCPARDPHDTILPTIRQQIPQLPPLTQTSTCATITGSHMPSEPTTLTLCHPQPPTSRSLPPTTTRILHPTTSIMLYFISLSPSFWEKPSLQTLVSTRSAWPTSTTLLLFQLFPPSRLPSWLNFHMLSSPVIPRCTTASQRLLLARWGAELRSGPATRSRNSVSASKAMPISFSTVSLSTSSFSKVVRRQFYQLGSSGPKKSPCP